MKLELNDGFCLVNRKLPVKCAFFFQWTKFSILQAKPFDLEPLCIPRDRFHQKMPISNWIASQNLEYQTWLKIKKIFFLNLLNIQIWNGLNSLKVRSNGPSFFEDCPNCLERVPERLERCPNCLERIQKSTKKFSYFSSVAVWLS